MKVLIVQPATVFKDGRPYKTKRRWVMGLALPYMAGLTAPYADVSLVDDRYDEINPELAAAREAGDEARIKAILAEFVQLKAEADAAHTAFKAEKAALLKRQEYYNPVVLAAMEQFVAEAPGEIAEAIAFANK